MNSLHLHSTTGSTCLLGLQGRVEKSFWTRRSASLRNENASYNAHSEGHAPSWPVLLGPFSTASQRLTRATRLGGALRRSLVGETRRWTSPAARASSDALRSPLNAQRAFTLVELLVVVLVLAILSSITISLFRYTMLRINQSMQKIKFNQITSALEDYRAAYGEYPITPPANPDDVRRHYPDNLATDWETRTNSPFTNVPFADNGTTVETCFSGAGAIYIDYSLTYPLMIKQLEKGANPFMEFPKVTMFYMVYRSLWDDVDESQSETYGTTLSGYLAGGGIGQVQTVVQGDGHRNIYGNPVNRYLAVDPISGNQWKYVCTNGVNYSLTTNTF